VTFPRFLTNLMDELNTSPDDTTFKPSHGFARDDLLIQILITIHPVSGSGSATRSLEIESNIGEDNTNDVLRHIVEVIPSLRPAD